MATIHRDILLEILVRLPASSIIRFKFVSKEWKHHLESWDFIQRHYNRSTRPDLESFNSSLIVTRDSSLYILADPSITCQLIELSLPTSFDQHKNNGNIEVIGSCNGFVCVACGHGLNLYFVFNPYFPASFLTIPHVPNHLNEHGYIRQCRSLLLGFGFDSHKNDFKIFFYGYYYHGQYLNTDFVSIFSFNSGSWKRLSSSLPYNLHLKRKESKYGVWLNNTLHWCGYSEGYKIVSFDLNLEEWNKIACPDTNKYSYLVKDMVVFKGCLSILTARTEYSNASPELWVMKEYGEFESWTKVLTLPLGTNLLVYSPCRSQVLLHNVRGIGWYDVDEGNGNVLDNEWPEFEIPSEAYKALCFFGTLVSNPSSTRMLEIVKGK